MFGGIEAAKSMQEYRCKIENCRLAELIALAGNIASAFERDAEKSHEPNLSIIRRALVPLVSGCFQTGCEIEAAMFPRHSRPTAEKCETTLRQVWQKLFHFSWSDYKKQIPQPKESPFEKYSYDFRASLYFELMEKVIFRMMKLRCKSLVSMVAPNEKEHVEQHIQWLEKVLESTEDNRRSFFTKHLKKEWLRAAATQREDNTMPCTPSPVPKKVFWDGGGSDVFFLVTYCA